jgi:hypothetical protein
MNTKTLTFTHRLISRNRTVVSKPRYYAAVLADQTKKNNSPGQENTEAHEQAATKTSHEESEGQHPAKRPDPQEPPTRSTGIQPEGPDGRAGDGK